MYTFLLDITLCDRFSALNYLTIFFLSILSWKLYLYLSKSLFVKKTKPPGPIGLPCVGYLPFLGAEPHKTLWKMKEKYGDIIGLNMGTIYTVVLNEYSVMKEVFTHIGSLDRAPNMFEHIPHLGFASQNGDIWQEQRKFCIFATKDMGLGKNTWEDLILEEVSSFTDKIQESGGESVNIFQSLSSSISSNIISLLIGRRLRKNKEADKIKLVVDFSEIALSYTSQSFAGNVIPGFRKAMEIFKVAGYERAAKLIQDFQNFIKEEIICHKNVPELKYVTDFINIYLKQMNELNLKNTKHYFSCDAFFSPYMNL